MTASRAGLKLYLNFLEETISSVRFPSHWARAGFSFPHKNAIVRQSFQSAINAMQQIYEQEITIAVWAVTRRIAAREQHGGKHPAR
jgi:hypothetical protein